MASLADGRSVVVWRDPGRSQSTLVFKIVNADGSVGSADTIINGSQTSTGTIQTPVITAMEDGGFAIAWDYNDTTDRNIWAKTYNSSGAQTSTETIAHANTTGLQTYPSIAASPGGGFGLVWTDNNPAVIATTSGNTAIMQRYFGPTGVPSTAAFRISDDYGGDFSAGFALSTFGTQAVAWDEDLGQVQSNGENEGIFGVWGVNNVSSAISGTTGLEDDSYAFPDVAFSGESFMAVWLGKPTAGNPYQIDARFNNGAFSAQVKANTTTLGGFFNTSQPGVAAIAGNANGFLVVWSDGSSSVGGSDFDVLGQYFTFGGAAVGSEFVITSSAIVNNSFGLLDVSATLDGRFLVTWSAGGPSTFSNEIFAQYVDPREVAQNWTGTGANQQYAGTALADILSGLGGNDMLLGYGGNDVLTGGTGADTLDGGDGVDIASYQGAWTPVFININGAVAGGDAAGDVMIRIESVVGGFANDVIVGDAGNNGIDGSGGADTLAGAGGNDAYVIDNLGDVVIEYANEGSDTVLSSVSYVMGAHIEIANLIGVGNEAVLGNDLANVITGNTGGNGLAGGANGDALYGNGGNDTLDGQIGADFMDGGTGVDTYFVDNAGDVVVEAVNGGEYDTIWTTTTFTLPSNVEIFICYGGGNINGVGNNALTLMLGNNDVNYFASLGGNDVVLGQGGNDYIDGGTANDTISGGTGSDTLIGGADSDLFVYATFNEGGATGDVYTDFTTGFGANSDILDLRPLFTTFAPGFGTTSASAIIAGYLTFTQGGADTYVFVDPNGGVHNPGEQVFLALLQNVNANALQANTLVV
ncbi:MAG: calcium-binding protein [Bosea sp. (in: a-proteobacteria)]